MKGISRLTIELHETKLSYNIMLFPRCLFLDQMVTNSLAKMMAAPQFKLTAVLSELFLEPD